MTSFALQPASDTGRLSTDRLTNAASLVFALVFDQSVTGIASGDFSTSGSATGCVIAPAGSGSAYTVTLTACSTGTLTLTLQASSVFGVGSNVGPSAPTSASVVTIDRAPPTLTLSAITASPSASTSLAYRLTGPEKIDCSTISSVIGVDFVATNLSAIGSITGSGTTVCTIPATSSVVPGLTGTSTLAKASTFSVADDAGNTQTAVAGSPASVTVTPTDTAPVAHNDVGLSVPQNGVAVLLSVLANDTDADLGTVLKISSATAPAHGTVAITGSGSGLTYTPAALYAGPDSFTYTITDGTLTSTAAVLLDVVEAGSVSRLSGVDRYATSAAISKASFPTPGVPVVTSPRAWASPTRSRRPRLRAAGTPRCSSSRRARSRRPSPPS